MNIKHLPLLVKTKEIKQNVHQLDFSNKKKLFLIGTAHVSANSVQLVEDIIREKAPDTICVELDEQRYKSITQASSYKEIDIIQIIRNNQLFFFMGQFIMASYQKKISEKTGSKPGLEFKRAIELADECNANLALCDRDIGITLKRAFRLTPFRHKMRFLVSLFVSDDDDFENVDIEELKNQDALENVVKSFEKELPITKRVLIDERDEYLTTKIIENLGKVTVAVVGAGHVAGMLKQMQTSNEHASNIEALEYLPSPSKAGKIIPWAIPIFVVAGLVWGILNGNQDMAKDVMIYWALVTGSLAALGSLLALAHPITILAGFVAAPFTTLHPALGVGFVTALVQTFMVKPRVKDFEEIQNHSLSIKKWWSNRVTRVFLVLICSSIGASIGTFVALPALMKIF